MASLRRLTSRATTSRNSSSVTGRRISTSRFFTDADSSRSVPSRIFRPARRASLISSESLALRADPSSATYTASVLAIVLGAVFGAGILCILYGIFVERTWFRVSTYRLDILPADSSGPVRVLHLSDLHFTRRDRRKRRFLASLPGADVTVVTGDMLGEAE